MTNPESFTHPEWDRIWAALNKLVEDIPVEQVETQWDKLMSEGYDLTHQLHALADEIEGSLEMLQNERDHHMEMFGAILDDGEGIDPDEEETTP
jgi:hypothetical protein